VRNHTFSPKKILRTGTDVEWLYVFDEAVTQTVRFVDVSAKEDVAVIDLNGEEAELDDD